MYSSNWFSCSSENEEFSEGIDDIVLVKSKLLSFIWLGVSEYKN